MENISLPLVIYAWGVLLTAMPATSASAAELLHQWTFNSGDGSEDIVGGAGSALRGTTSISNDQLLIPTYNSVDGMEFETGGEIR